MEGAHDMWFPTENQKCMGRDYTIKLYIPSRMCMVLCPYENVATANGPIETMPKVTDRQLSQVKGAQSIPPQLYQQAQV